MELSGVAKGLVLAMAVGAPAVHAGVVIPRPYQVKIHGDSFSLGPKTVLYYERGSVAIRDVGKQLAGWIGRETGYRIKVRKTAATAPDSGSILLSTFGASSWLGEEGYELLVRPGSVLIRARSATGLFYGAQTLRQLLMNPGNGWAKPSWRIPCMTVRDRPRFVWRGMHLDCGRHFMSVKFIKRFIDHIAAYKFNRFHWHLTEDQGWRIKIRKYPELTSVGAWRQHEDERYGGYYSRRDIKEIVEHAQRRQVMVIPEIEMPGHCQSALAAYPDLSCTGGPFEVSTRWGIHKDVFCAGNERVFEVLRDVLSDVVELFPAPYIHLGADEVPKDRWKACPKCQRRIREEGLKDEHELQAYFIHRITKFLRSKNRRVIGWDEVLEGGPPKDVIVQAWRGYGKGIEAARAGHEVIFSPTSHCYFDYSWETTDLRQVYSFNPVSADLAPEYRRLVLGGEGCVWTEGITEARSDRMVFPRMLGLAEVLWSPAEPREFDEFLERVRVHEKRMKREGITFGPALALDAKKPVKMVRSGHVASTLGTYRHYDLARAFDGDEDSYFWSNRAVQDGDTLTLTLDEPLTCERVSVTTGFGFDWLGKGVLEISEDGETFVTVTDFKDGVVRVEFVPHTIKAIRLRMTASTPSWLIVREISFE